MAVRDEYEGGYMTKHDEVLRRILRNLFLRGQQFEQDSKIGEAENSEEAISQVIRQINDLFNKKKSEVVLDEDKILKILCGQCQALKTSYYCRNCNERVIANAIAQAKDIIK